MRKVWLPVVVVLVALAAAPAASAVTDIPRGRLGIGDSIMLSATDELDAYEVEVHAKVGRQFDGGLHVARRLEAGGRLKQRVIVHLGTNGWIDPDDCDALVGVAGPHRRVFLLTVRVPRDWMKPNNEVIRTCAAAHERAYLIRWSMVSGRHPEWFVDDGYHLNATGQERYAAFIDRTVDAILARVRGGG
jgi:hypothetical protein